MKRKFAVVKRYADAGLELPKRATAAAAGYDLAVAEDFVVPSIWRHNFLKTLVAIWRQSKAESVDLTAGNQVLKPFLVPTGIKAYMQPNEVLLLANRSSNPRKRFLVLPNGIGVIDADYVDNVDNEGEIFVQLLNFGLTDAHLKKGERIAQGIFVPYLLTDDDEDDEKETRQGGFGSTGIN